MKRSLAHRLQNLFSRANRDDEAFFEEFEDVLLGADLGATLALELGDELRARGLRRTSRRYVTCYASAWRR